MQSPTSEKSSDHSQLKQCSRCKSAKPSSEFYTWLDKRSGQRKQCARCSDCCCEVRRNYIKKHPEKVKRLKKEYYTRTQPERVQAARDWRLANPERHKEQSKKTRIKNRKKIKLRDVEWRYGIKGERYQQALAEQNNSCAICGTHGSTQRRALDIDHCHTTGKFRGLLCNKCNAGIGHFNDDTERMLAAIEYLRKHQEKRETA